ncbi:hypothetical protein HBH98_197380 [Parastagonospora nodorum]|nr:hypothetical protein HBI95_091370 [Parastagonospora nodorum]KAH4340105.1 hypothetical protein HBH98_197380 [Parastagonospora nodorum]KAH4364190.1 hypothetical protein HBH97_180770 [Parastagonospora nodorum]KAH4383940.1 hypothetical protein HBH99_181680 [Parastagonospora nodorum]KAH5130907.1 hypothetical protein HBH70_184790 [Parastagonospora nodorum]
MHFLRNLISRLPSKFKRSIVGRRYAHVHDITIKVNDKILGSMSLNVFKQPLALHSTKPLTGFMRTGYCEAPKQDLGNHSVAAIVTNEFLDFSAARGNDLRQAGLTDGCKWCLCVSRWREAFEARTGDDDKKVPKIVLKATNERALEGVKMEDLKRFAVDKE